MVIKNKKRKEKVTAGQEPPPAFRQACGVSAVPLLLYPWLQSASQLIYSCRKGRGPWHLNKESNSFGVVWTASHLRGVCLMVCTDISYCSITRGLSKESHSQCVNATMTLNFLCKRKVLSWIQYFQI